MFVPVCSSFSVESLRAFKPFTDSYFSKITLIFVRIVRIKALYSLGESVSSSRISSLPRLLRNRPKTTHFNRDNL